MLVLSYSGEAGAVWIAVGIALLFFRKTRAAGVMLLISLLMGLLIGELGLKNIVCRPRPFLVNTAVKLNIHAPSGYSFPSGHSAAAFASATVLVLRGKRWMGISAVVLAVLISFSRLYNYVHYPSDVLCGALLGVSCALLVVFVFKKTRLDQRLSGNLQYKGGDGNDR